MPDLPTFAEAGIAGNTQTGQHTAGSRGFIANPGKDNAVAWNNGNVYAGHDGSVYQHTENGWQKHTANGWEPVQANNEVTGRLEQQRQARELGQQRFNGIAQQWQGRGVGAGGGGSGGRGFRGGGFHGGFRR
ncbi:hypothetical protein D3C72_1894160 [compost metagenome]